MTNFANYHMGSWRVGEMPSLNSTFHVVSYDQKNNVYEVPRGKYEEFISWVAYEWAKSDAVQGDDESSVDYLERIGVDIRELNLA